MPAVQASESRVSPMTVWAVGSPPWPRVRPRAHQPIGAVSRHKLTASDGPDGGDSVMEYASATPSAALPAERLSTPVRRSGMRPYVLLVGVVLMLSAAGCGSGSARATGDSAEVATAPSYRPSAEAAPPSSNRASVAASDPTPSRKQPQGRPLMSPNGGPQGGGDPDNPSDLVGAPVVLTGTISRDDGCVALDVSGRRWALTGAPAVKLVDGQQVTVRGRPVAVPTGCDAAFALALRPLAGR